MSVLIAVCSTLFWINFSFAWTFVDFIVVTKGWLFVILSVSETGFGS